MIRLLASLVANLSIALIFAVGGVAGLVEIYGHDLPSYDELRSYHPKMLTRVYSGTGDVIAEFARQRRIFAPIDEVPDLVKHAFVSAEDKNFYTHPGVDALAIAKAIGRYAIARLEGHHATLAGASGITQQVVKNFLVGDERSVERKIREAILAVRVDGALSKDQILELYLNDIYLGARAYGIVAAAQNYFGKTLEQLKPEEAAFLAALPKEPSNLNPLRNHDGALARRNYVLRRMMEDGVIDRAEYERAVATPLDTILDKHTPTVLGDYEPGYFTDEIRRQLIDEVGVDELYHGGLTVRATIDHELQRIATRALRHRLEDYDRTHGEYRGPVATIQKVADGDTDNWRAPLGQVDAPRDIAGWHLAVVLDVADDSARVGVEGLGVGQGDGGPDDGADTSADKDAGQSGEDAGKTAGEGADDGADDGIVRLTLERERQWIRHTPRSSGRPHHASDIWQRGDVVYVEREDDGWAMRQIPKVEGAFMAMDPDSGRVLALVGGFSYQHSMFDRATQAKRQPGSAFKPFVYAAALDAGYTPDTVVLDAPIAIDNGTRTWRPQNSEGEFSGPLPLRRGLELSKNLMTVRIAAALGMDRVGMYAERFGVYDDLPQPTPLSYALGAGETTLYQLVAAYGMFANGGKRVQPTLIDRVQDRHGKTLYSHDPRVCQGCDVETFRPDHTPVLFDQRSQIISPETAYQLVDMLQGVVTRGTASRTVGGLPFPVAGKTGTTNESKDAWFIGFTRNMVAGCFIGFDTPTPMGPHAYGASLCGPVFREFIKEAMVDRNPGEFRPPPQGETVTLMVDSRTGERVAEDAEGPTIVARTYDLGTPPEIQVADSSALADDAVLFGAYGADLPYILPEGEDVPLSRGEGGAAGGGGGGAIPANVGLGTGGLY